VTVEELASGDALGPERVILLRRPEVGLAAAVVVDNTAAGAAIGGVRMAPDVTLAECRRLARAMTLENATAGLRHGGAKAVVAADPGRPHAEKERLVRAFARAIADLTDYVPGPDMGTDETAMAWIREEIGRAVGLPAVLGGIPLDAIGATGFGLAVAAEVAAERRGLDLVGARVGVQGYGAVGRHAARHLAARGAVIVAVADSAGTAIAPRGLDLAALDRAKAERHSVVAAANVTGAPREAVLDVACEIWIPAARPDVLTGDNVGRLDTRLVLEGANIPVTPDAEAALHERGVLCLPDFVANAGGVVCAAAEYAGGDERTAFAAIETKIRADVAAVLDAAGERPPREAALALAEARVVEAMSYRRFR
jgi:glutamate dehydrogenase/leucine dehydrogenase